MAIVQMSEFSLLVLNEKVNPLLEKLQIFNNITFKPVENHHAGYFSPSETAYDFQRNQFLQERLQDVLQSVDKIEKKIEKKSKRGKLQKLNIQKITFQELTKRCQHIDIEQLLDTYDQFYDISTQTVVGYECYRPWLNKKMDPKMVSKLKIQNPLIGTVTKEIAKNLITSLQKTTEALFWTCELNSDEVLLVILTTEEATHKIEILLEKSHFKKRSASSLGIQSDVAEMIQLVKQLLDKQTLMEERLQNIGHYREELQLYYEYLKNEALRFTTKKEFLSSKYVTQISGWIYTEEIEKFQQLLATETNDTYFLEVHAAPSDSKEVPIKLRNKKFFKAFEGITNMYSLPRYNELDPTPLLTFFYAIFFGMMLGDVGYGLLMGLGSFLALHFLNLKTSTENFLRFLLYLSVPTVIIGWIYSSFFGGAIPIKGLIDVNQDFMWVMIFALCFGIFHLFFGLAIKAYMFIKNKKPLYALFDVGFWYITLAGAIILISKMFTDLLAPYSKIGMFCLFGGMIGIVLTNGREAKTIPGKFAAGLYSLYGLTDYIGDVLSYSRLMALGLAGASIGSAFNMIVRMLSRFGFFGILGGLVVFVIGHSFNIGISGLSAYVHSARLTYVEFFGKFYTGGGKRFKEFRSPTTYINLENEEDLSS